jgi:hypothetical protein
MIFEKLQKARIELQNKKLKKTGKNGYSGFTYYELADFLPQVNQIFYDLKLHSNFSIENEQASLTVTDWEDNTKEVFTSPIEDLELKGCTKIQALGGVHTYMKRYLYLNALEIVESDMLDAKAGSIEEVKTQKEQIKEVKNDNDILAGIVQCKTEEECNDYWKNNVSKLSGANARKQLAELKKQRIEAIKEGK